MVYLFAGRFQPFHNGHLATIKKSYETVRSKIFVLMVQDIPQGEDRPIGSEHFEEGKNPFELELMLPALQKLSVRHSGLFIPIPVPQPSTPLGQRCIASLFPTNRIWLIPDTGDRWDDQKNDFYRKAGEVVKRIDVDRIDSGTSIRQAIMEENWDFVRKVTPEEVFSAVHKDND